ncbi:hypothetical protein HPP92_005779 [Vanilla planifolia]|uniref:Ubiquitinyl hydrolase 1 n=1 Tax=Vanilla planifolia TaxID=51239 RepID=A0A835RHS8_VANPL|nr:hypothetical protein HPP92_005779 [Vanilla planifolia]
MYGSLDLGVSGTAAVALIIFAHVIAAVIRRRWTLAQARREEVVHLVKLASEETARAELEASIGYLPETKMPMDVCGGRSLGVPSRFECAVCHRPTNTRCSRCKAVRYCSGTCQIIHWRQGHKDECCDPQVNHQNKLQERNPSDLQAENLKSLPNTVVTMKRSHGKLIAANLEEQSSGHKLSTYGSSNDALVEPKTLLDSCEAKHCPGSSVDSFTGRSIHPDPSVNPSEEALLSYSHDKTAEEFSLGICSCPEVIADPGNIGFPLAGSGDSSLSMNILSHTASLRKQMFTHSSKDIEYSSNDCSVSDFVQSNHGKNVEFSQCPDEGRKSCSEFDTASIRISSNNPEQNGISKARAIKDNSCVNSCDECMKESILKDCRCFCAEKSGFVPGRKSADGWLHNSRTFRRAAHHLKLSQSLRGSMTMAASELSQKHRLVFPFEFFVKLYNSDKVDMKPFGLFNCGNSCFANAVLQCLLHTRPLISYHYQGLHSGTCPRGQWCFTCEFENLILRGKQGESPVSPVGILSNIKKIGSHFGHGREEDAHEFLRYAIDAMQSASTNGAVGAGKYSEDASLIQLTFGGYLLSEVKCMKCQAKSEQLERIMDLTVEIHGDIGSLEEALRQFTATEVLDGDNRYNCSRCKSFERAKKRLSVFQAPNVLTIALKRFQLGKFGKLNKPVSFPALLDLSPYASTVDRSALYSLYAVVVHEDVNNFTYSGHYICYVKSLKEIGT